MTFKHKLSKRLALIRGLWFAAAATAVACNDAPMSAPRIEALASPASITTTFNVGDRVKTTGTANVRSGPKGSASLLGAQPVGALGYVLGGPIVDSTGDKLTRFNVNFDNAPDGWVAQEYAGLTLVAPAPAPPTVASVTVSPATASVLVGATVQLAATPQDSAGTALSGPTITWSSSSASLATVSASGLVTGVAAGGATITATSGGKSGSAAITVTVPAPTVASVTVTPSTASLAVGATAQLAATPKDASGNPVSGQTVTWSTSSTSIASVSATGLVTGVAAGSATVTATSSGKSGTAAITVTAPAPPPSTWAIGARVSSNAANVRSGPSASATLLGQQPSGALGTIVGGPITDVTGDGLVRWQVDFDTGVDGWAAQSYLTLVASAPPPPPAPVVASVAVSPKPASVLTGNTMQLSAIAKDSSGTVVSGASMSWRSRDTTKAKVSASGLVTGVALGTAYVLATSGAISDSSAVSVTQVPVASVGVSPATASINVAATVQLAATTKDASGATLTGRTVTWTTSSAAIAGVAATGLVTGVAAGTATITATSEGKTGSASVTVTAPAPPPPPPPTSHAGWYAAPNGSSGGSGSISSPWNLSTALSGAGGRVHAGDTVWVRGGTYLAPFRSTLTGTAAAPIVVRAYPGERTIIDGGSTTSDNFVVAGSYSIIWGLEFTNTNLSRYTSDATSHSYRADNIINQGPHNKYINLIVHDGGVGFYTYSAYPDLTVYGCILFNNGWDSSDRGHGHALYLKNDVGPVLAKDNVIFNQFGYGIHMYTNSGDGLLNGLWAEGNISFDNGSISQWTTSANIGNLGQPLANNMGIVNNMTYFAPSLSGTNLTLGSGSNLTATGNYVVGGSGITQGTWTGATISGNTALSAATGSGSPRVFVRPNLYEAGRANVAVYNPAGQGAVSVDLTGVLSIGDSYVVRNVQDLFGTPVASGTYSGGSISIPMGGVTPPVPVGLSSSRAPRTGPYFDTFLVTKS